MRHLPKTLEGYCEDCKMDATFRYVSSSPLATDRKLRHYYAHSCGRTYTMDKLITLGNMHEHVTTKKR
jgi:hypothetical protein